MPPSEYVKHELQEALFDAWRGFDGFEGRGTPRVTYPGWLPADQAG